MGASVFLQSFPETEIVKCSIFIVKPHIVLRSSYEYLYFESNGQKKQPVLLEIPHITRFFLSYYLADSIL